MAQKQKPWVVPVIAAVVLLFLLVCGLGGFAGWKVYQDYSKTVPPHKGFGEIQVNKPLAEGWTAMTFPELGFTIELPAVVTAKPRTMHQRSYTWITSYESFHGRVSTASFIVGALWMDPSNPHFSSFSTGKDQVAQFYSNKLYSKVVGSVTPKELFGRQVALTRVDYSYKGDYTQRGLCFPTKDCVVYILETYKIDKAAEAEALWNRVIGSIKFSLP